MQRDDLPLPPSGKWHGTFTSRIVGEKPETAWYKFHPDGRVTGRVENKFEKYAVDGTYDRATGAFTSTGTSGNFRVKHTGTITGHTLEMKFETMALDSVGLRPSRSWIHWTRWREFPHVRPPDATWAAHCSNTRFAPSSHT